MCNSFYLIRTKYDFKKADEMLQIFVFFLFSFPIIKFICSVENVAIFFFFTFNIDLLVIYISIGFVLTKCNNMFYPFV